MSQGESKKSLEKYLAVQQDIGHFPKPILGHLQEQSMQKFPVSTTNALNSTLLLNNIQKSKVLDSTPCKNIKSMSRSQMLQMLGV